MEKKADCRIGKSFPQELRQDHKMVIMDPYNVIGLGDPNYLAVELLIHLDIGIPVPSIVCSVLREIVKKRPYGPVAETIVIVLQIMLAYEHGMTALFFQSALDPASLRDHPFGSYAGPAEPDVLISFRQRTQTGCEPTNAGMESYSIFAFADGHRQPVGNDEYSFHGDSFVLQAILLLYHAIHICQPSNTPRMIEQQI